jgi:hypothetical protein
MSGLHRVSRLFLAGGMLAVSTLFLGSCGNYALFKLHVTTAPTSPVSPPNGTGGSNRGQIDQCYLTVTDENNVKVVDGYLLLAPATTDSAGNLVVKGCKAGFTPADLELLSYSTSRTSGTLTFRVDGYDSDHKVILQAGKSGAVAPKAFPPVMDQIEIVMGDPSKVN